jgi:ferric iron reductase protein FhuF
VALQPLGTVGYVDTYAGVPDDSDGGEEREWSHLPDLIAGVDGWLARLEERTGGDHAVAAMFLCGWAMRALVAVPVASLARAEPVLETTVDDCWLELVPGGWVTGITFAPDVRVAPADERFEATVVVLRELAEPVVEAVHARSRVGRRGLWSTVVDTAARQLVEDVGRGSAAAALAREIARELPLPPGLGPRFAPDGTAVLSACCLAFRLPELEYCDGCPVPKSRSAAG